MDMRRYISQFFHLSTSSLLPSSPSLSLSLSLSSVPKPKGKEGKQRNEGKKSERRKQGEERKGRWSLTYERI